MRRHAKASFAGSTLGSGIRRDRLGLVCLCVLGLAAFLGSSAPSAGAQACPNETFRQGASANLPDCRAYERVSPADKEGQQVDVFKAFGTDFPPLASLNGDSAAWNALGAFEPSASSGVISAFLSRRGASGWSTEGISPPIDPAFTLNSAFPIGLTEDLQNIVFAGNPEPPLTPEASPGSGNLYLRDNVSASYRLLSPGLPAGLGEAPFFQTRGLPLGAPHVVFSSPGPNELTGCGAPAVAPRLCDWSAATGTLALVGRAPVTDAVLTSSVVKIAGLRWQRPVSADGSRVFFDGGGEGCGVCVRVNGATTQIVDETGTFQTASSDGSVAYVTDGGALERYDVNADVLTPIVEPADEVQGVLGASSDGSRVYFVAKGELAPGATVGMNNLYLWTQGGGFDFIATGTNTNTFKNNWKLSVSQHTSRVTPDGMHLAFQADNSLTGYPDEGNPEAYLYSAATGALVCASCNPSGAPATSGATITGGPSLSVERLSRNLSNDGSYLFVNTKEALVPQDTNGLQDVYEYGAASGQVALISTGTGEALNPGVEVFFSDASASGSDVLFGTRQQLVGTDKDEAVDVYDARVDGGLASQNPPAPAAPCTGNACRSETAPLPSQPNSASAAVIGRGNLAQRQNCSKLGREAKKLSNRAKKLRRHAKQAKRNGKSKVAKKRNRKATRLAKRARNKSKSAKRCRKANRRASK